MAALTREVVDSEHFVARYARGGLSEAEREAFEEYCLLHPDIAEQVATDRTLLAGLRELETRPVRRINRPAFRYSLAAGVAALVVMVGALAYFRLIAVEPIALYASLEDLPAGIQTTTLGRGRIAMTRSAQPTVFAVAPSVQVLQVDFDPGLSTAIDFEFRLIEHTAGGDVVLGQVRQSLQDSDQGRVAPLVIALGKAREPRLRLEVQFDGTSESYEFRVVRK